MQQELVLIAASKDDDGLYDSLHGETYHQAEPRTKEVREERRNNKSTAPWIFLMDPFCEQNGASLCCRPVWPFIVPLSSSCKRCQKILRRVQYQMPVAEQKILFSLSFVLSVGAVLNIDWLSAVCDVC